MLTRTSIMMLLFIVYSLSAFVGNSFNSDVHDGETVNPTSPGSEEKCTCSPCGTPCNTPSLPPPSPPPPPPPLPIYSPPSPYCPPPPYYASSPPPPPYYGSPPPPSYYDQTPPPPNFFCCWKPPGSLYPIDQSYNLSADGRSFSMILHAFLGWVLLALLEF